MTVTLSRICRYPVKGLSPDDMETVSLQAGETLPFDRRFAFALGSTRFENGTPHWLPKTSFYALVQYEKLATLVTGFDDETTTLTIYRDGRQVSRGKLDDPIGRAILEDFFSAFMKDEGHGQPRLVEMPAGDAFTDQKKQLVSIVNLASVRDLERVTKTEINPSRFRANIYIDGLEPWAEFDAVGKNITIGGLDFNLVKRTERCAAVNVDPDSGKRDINLLRFLKGGFGHVDMGVFARVETSGEIAIDDKIVF